MTIYLPFQLSTILLGMLTVRVSSLSRLPLLAERLLLLPGRRRPIQQFQASTSSSTESNASTKTSSFEVPVILLKRSRQSKAFRNGNQLVFTRAIKNADPTLQTADLVQVVVEADKEQEKPIMLGWGVYNPDSLYKVRILCHRFLQPSLHAGVMKSQDEKQAMTQILRHHLSTAVALRSALQLPNEKNSMYRLFNGEGDGLSGLAIDVVADVVVVMSSAAWCQIHRETIIEVLGGELPDHKIVWKTTPSRLEQDGYRVKDHAEENMDNGDVEVFAKENGVLFSTFPASDGQKTGVYCDQRENREYFARLCKGKKVLDLCCYHGGFTFNAIKNGGAVAGTGVDSSAAAIEVCNRNAALNDCESQTEFVQADIAKFLQQSVGSKTYDAIVLDPPKLAPTVSGLNKARRKYHSLNRDAIAMISPDGGLLMTCTCSAAMTQKDGGQFFLAMVQGAAQAVGRQVTLLSVAGAAPCHAISPVSLPAGAYLTAATFYVHPLESKLTP